MERDANEVCKNCASFHCTRDKDTAEGQCRKKPPTVLQVAGTNTLTLFPEVKPNNWCMQFSDG